MQMVSDSSKLVRIQQCCWKSIEEYFNEKMDSARIIKFLGVFFLYSF